MRLQSAYKIHIFLSSKWARTKSHLRRIVRRIGPYFFTIFFFRTFFLVLISRIFCSSIFSRTIFPYFFKSLKSNVLKYQWVVFLVHIVTTQFMFLAGYPFKRHPYGFPWTGGVRACAIWRDQKWIYLKQKRIEMFYSTNQSYHWKLNQSEVDISGRLAIQKPEKRTDS